ncbi:MAG: integrase [unclassified Hahellaceae]|nr:integrase [Hahellaceae bacterium]|tara:strand:- start:5553 stop:7250 length:1698 start_codon:yes stop_codon:yes gene_type:complete
MAQPSKHPISGVFYFRREVPEAIRGILNKREWKVSLRTKELSEARLRFAAKSLECEECFSAARDQLAGKSRLLLADAPRLADQWAKAEVDSWETEPERIDAFLVSSESGLDSASEYVDGDTPQTRALAVFNLVEIYLADRRLPVPSQAEPLRYALVDSFFYRWISVCDLAFQRKRGNWSSHIDLPLAETPLAVERQRVELAQQGPTLTAVFEKWAEDKLASDGRNRSTVKTVAEFKTVIIRFTELFGDLPVIQITKPVVQDFRLKLGEIPVKGQGLRGLTALELILKAEAENLPTASLGTVRKQLRALSTILSFAKKRLGVLQEEPVAASGIIGQLLKSAKRADASEHGDKEYSWADLVSIFKSPIYSKGWKPPIADYGEAFYWLPLLMAYTGARREELTQLTVDDVRQDETTQVWHLSMRPTGDKSIKTESSKRRIPLHPDLLELNFLAYKDSVPAEGRLFPKLRFHPTEGYGHNYGKRWKEYLQKVAKIESKADPVHGFRHTFKSLCREAYIPREVHDWITGHANQNVGDTYGQNPLMRMSEELKRFPSIARAAGLIRDQDEG